MQPLRVAVVTRESQVGAWVVEQARQRNGIEVVSASASAEAYVDASASAEAYVLVTPADEAPSDISLEWRAKPVAFVTYGPGSGAVEQLRSVLADQHVVIVGLIATAYDASAATAMFEQLEWWGRALRDRRSS